MKTQLIARMLLLSGLAVYGNAAMASDELAGALIGAGTGAVIGNAIDRHDGAVVGGVIGAVLGIAIAGDDDRRYAPVYRSRPIYRPAPVVVYEAPRVRYIEQPVLVEYRPLPYRWHYERYDRHDRHDGHDSRRGRDNRDKGRWHEERGDRRGW